jgi:hypothetical protein
VRALRWVLILTALLPVWALAPGRALAGPIVLDFEGLPAMGNSPGSPIPSADRLANAFLSTDGVKFRSGSQFVAVVNLGPGHATSGDNGIGGSTPGGRLTYDPAFPIVASFFDPHHHSRPAVTDFVSVRGDLRGANGPVTLNAFDVGGTLIGSFTTPDSGGETLLLSVPGIHSVQIIGNTDPVGIGGVAFDDFTFDPVTPAGSTTPEPAAGILLACGLVMVGVTQYLKRRRTAIWPQ